MDDKWFNDIVFTMKTTPKLSTIKQILNFKSEALTLCLTWSKLSIK